MKGSDYITVTVALPNYTGSLGFGQEKVDALVGKSGYLDVEECFAASKYLVKEGYSVEGSGKQFVAGGSHGGFLGAHCTSIPYHCYTYGRSCQFRQ